MVSSYSDAINTALQPDAKDAGAHKPRKPRHLRLPPIQEWQFYDRPRLYELQVLLLLLLLLLLFGLLLLLASTAPLPLLFFAFLFFSFLPFSFPLSGWKLCCSAVFKSRLAW